MKLAYVELLIFSIKKTFYLYTESDVNGTDGTNRPIWIWWRYETKPPFSSALNLLLGWNKNTHFISLNQSPTNRKKIKCNSCIFLLHVVQVMDGLMTGGNDPAINERTGSAKKY